MLGTQHARRPLPWHPISGYPLLAAYRRFQQLGTPPPSALSVQSVDAVASSIPVAPRRPLFSDSAKHAADGGVEAAAGPRPEARRRIAAAAALLSRASLPAALKSGGAAALELGDARTQPGDAVQRTALRLDQLLSPKRRRRRSSADGLDEPDTDGLIEPDADGPLPLLPRVPDGPWQLPDDLALLASHPPPPPSPRLLPRLRPPSARALLERAKSLAHKTLLATLRGVGVPGPAAHAINLAVTRRHLPSDPAALSLLLSCWLLGDPWGGVLSREDLFGALARCPTLLHRAPSEHLAVLARASAALGLPGTTVAGRLGADGSKLLVRLLHDPAWLPGRLALLRELLDLPRPAVARMVSLCPRLLLMGPRTVAAHLVQLTAVLGATPTQAARAVFKWPSLLTLKGDGLGARAAAARGALGMRPKAFATTLLRCPPLLQQNPGTLVRKRAALGAALRLEGADLDRVVFHFPWVLSQNADTVASHIGALEVMLGLSPHQVGQLLFHIPALLGFKPETLALKVDQLSDALGCTRAGTVSIIAGKPAVLASSVEKVAGAWRLLTHLAAAAPTWADSMASLSPASLGLVITSSDRRLLRLRYLDAAGLQAHWSFVTALVRPDADFHEKFPLFRAWADGRNAVGTLL